MLQLDVMFIKKTLAVFIIIAVFLAGYLSATVIYEIYPVLKKLLAPPPPKTVAAPPPPVPAAPLPPPPQPADFFQYLNIGELAQFDQLYKFRQNELRDLIAAGNEGNATPMIPPGVFAQLEMIKGKIIFLNGLRTYSDNQNAMRQNFLTSYQFLQQTFEKEIEFLKNYPTQGQNINFITENIFDISAKDQQSGMQFLESMIQYRKILAEAIREDQGTEKNQTWVRDLVTVNAMIEEYRVRLNVPKDTAYM